MNGIGCYIGNWLADVSKSQLVLFLNLHHNIVRWWLYLTGQHRGQSLNSTLRILNQKEATKKHDPEKDMEEPMNVFVNLLQGAILNNVASDIFIEQYTWFRVVLSCTSPAFLERPALQSFRIRASSPAEIAVVVGSPRGSKGKKSRDHNLRTEAEMKIAKLQLLFGKNFLVSSYAWVIQSLNSSEMGWQ